MSKEILQFRPLLKNESFGSLCSELKEFLNDNVASFGRVLIGDLSHIDNRAEAWDDPEIEDVTYKENGEHSLSYRYQYNIYNGCADMDIEGEEDESTTFTLDRNGIVEIEISEITNHYSERIYED